MAKTGALKDLEAYILGVVAEHQPCSPYFIHKTFRASPSLFFSGSAGAIYPAVKRLQKKGLVEAERSGTRGKPSKSLTITPKGRNEFLSWYLDTSQAGDSGYDPIRGRISVMGALPPNTQSDIASRMFKIAEKRLAEVKSLQKATQKDVGMPWALEMERVTLEAKIKLLKKWAGIT